MALSAFWLNKIIINQPTTYKLIHTHFYRIVKWYMFATNLTFELQHSYEPCFYTVLFFYSPIRIKIFNHINQVNQKKDSSF